MRIFFQIKGRGRKKFKKALKMTSQLVIFRVFFFFFFFFFFNISRKNSKTGKANQQYVLNFNYFIIFLKIWTGQSLFSVTLKNTQTEPQKDIIFSTKQIIFRVGG